MKLLIILRHGKSDWGNPELDDFDRPLNERGKKNAVETGFFLSDKFGKPDIMLSSGAKRAIDTAKLAAQRMRYKQEDIQIDADLYLASVPVILRSIARLSNVADSCILIGHNPGLTNLINYFGINLDNLPTASVACFECNTDKWENISPKNSSFQWIKLARDL